jgi:hypothetical protein
MISTNTARLHGRVTHQKMLTKGQQLSYDGIMRTELWKAISPEKASLCAKKHQEYAGLAECFKASQPLEPFKY